ncbi:Protein phosphatase 1 regulatory subunit 3E [Allomyces arbusculus]|nr:Protein phosphatase 1 regulatory subunit 3E [Allomyces arbusculus]
MPLQLLHHHAPADAMSAPRPMPILLPTSSSPRRTRSMSASLPSPAESSAAHDARPQSAPSAAHAAVNRALLAAAAAAADAAAANSKHRRSRSDSDLNRIMATVAAQLQTNGAPTAVPVSSTPAPTKVIVGFAAPAVAAASPASSPATTPSPPRSATPSPVASSASSPRSMTRRGLVVPTYHLTSASPVLVATATSPAAAPASSPESFKRPIAIPAASVVPTNTVILPPATPPSPRRQQTPPSSKPATPAPSSPAPAPRRSLRARRSVTFPPHLGAVRFFQQHARPTDISSPRWAAADEPAAPRHQYALDAPNWPVAFGYPSLPSPGPSASAHPAAVTYAAAGGAGPPVNVPAPWAHVALEGVHVHVSVDAAPSLAPTCVAAEPRRDAVALAGTIAVRGGATKVAVRVTLDWWRTFQDVDAVYAGAGTHPGWDRYTVLVPIETWSRKDLGLDEAVVHMCVRAEFEGGEEQWDNNGGSNYEVRVMRRASAHHPASDGEVGESEEKPSAAV